MNPQLQLYLGMAFTAFVSLTILIGYAVRIWLRERREDRELKLKQFGLEIDRLAQQVKQESRAEARGAEQSMAEKAGPGSGGYIVVEMPEAERPLFHDLLKGFEDYAKLKGYELAFSIDSSLEGHIAFKFTVKNDGFVVGAERVRSDFKEYMENIRNGEVEDLDHLPVITNLEEHNLVVITNVRSFPALPAPSVIVQTGGTMDSRKYDARHSTRLIQGDNNTYTDSSVNIDIGQSFTERQARIAGVDDLVERLKASEVQTPDVQKARRALENVRDEITDVKEPDKSTVKKWLEIAKSSMATAALGLEVTEAAKKLLELFGLS
jgi:hypothetical protein